MMFLKQSIAIAVFFMACKAGTCQKLQRLTISGKLEFAAQGERILNFTCRKLGGGRPEFDSAKVNDGVFKFEKEINEPIVVALSLKPGPGVPSNTQGTLDYLSLFLLPGETKILASENLRSAVVSGKAAVANNDYQAYEKNINLYIHTINQSMAVLRNLSLPPEEGQKRSNDIKDSIYLIRDRQVYLNFIKSNPQSPVAALAVLQYAGEPVWTPRKKMVPEEIEQLLKGLPKNLLSFPSIENLKEELSVSKSTGTGRPIIDFTLEDTAGRKVSLSDFKGQYVFLDFWASWCVPCRKENPNVKKQFLQYKDRGFTVVSVSLDKPDAKEAWINAIRKDEIGLWTHLGDLNGFDGKVARAYYVKSIPTNFLIGPDGKFLGRNLYGEALNKVLAKIFNNKN